MSLARGSVKVQSANIFGEISGITEDQIFGVLLQSQFVPIPADSTTDSSIGIVNWKDVTSAPQMGDVFLADGWVVFGVRQDLKRILKALIEMQVKSDFEAHKAAHSEKKFNFKIGKEMAKETLMPKTTPVPSLFLVALNLRKQIIFCEGKVLTWVEQILGRLGMEFEDMELMTKDNVLNLVKEGIIMDFSAMDKPEFVADELTYSVQDALDMALGTQKMAARKIATELNNECNEFLKAGARIKKLSILLSVDERNYKVNLKPNMEQLAVSIGKAEDVENEYEALLWRIDILHAIHWTVRELGK
jgi:hypothetical protein